MDGNSSVSSHKIRRCLRVKASLLWHIDARNSAEYRGSDMATNSLQSIMTQCAVMKCGSFGKFRHQKIVEDSEDEFTLTLEIYDRFSGVTPEGEVVLSPWEGKRCAIDRFSIRWKDLTKVESGPVTGYYPCVSIRWVQGNAEIWTENQGLADQLGEAFEQKMSVKAQATQIEELERKNAELEARLTKRGF